MAATALDAATAGSVLTFLGLQQQAPTVPFLEALINAYVRSVPWESAFRIAALRQWREGKEARNGASPVRWPRQFWTDALERGGGGTCFESNYAFFSLLRYLGYQGYLTINNMGKTIGCHTAIVVEVDGERWLVDVGIPLYAPLCIDSEKATRRETGFHAYTVRPDGERHFQIERDRHPLSNCFTLIDQPVPDALYRKATEADYGPKGLFLDRVIINKVIGDVPWRFNSGEQPLHLESFPDGRRVDIPVGEDVAAELAQHFVMDEAVLRLALDG